MTEGYYYCLNCHSEITPDYNEHCSFCGTCAIAVDGDYTDEEVERAFELLEKEQQGRLYEVPCRVGDKVFSPNIDARFEAVIENIRITETDVVFEWVQYDKGVEETEVWDEGSFFLNDFGKTVFLSNDKQQA